MVEFESKEKILGQTERRLSACITGRGLQVREFAGRMPAAPNAGQNARAA